MERINVGFGLVAVMNLGNGQYRIKFNHNNGYTIMDDVINQAELNSLKSGDYSLIVR